MYDKFGTKEIICNNWGEFFSEFKSWHAKNKGVIPPEHIANEESFSNYVGFDGESFGDFWERDKKGRIHAGFSRESFLNNGEVYSVETVLGPFHKIGCPVNELAVLVLNLHGSKIRYNDWKEQEKKASKVLREIWVTGVAKDTRGLDLNWPKESHPANNPLIEDKNQPKKYENLTKEQLISKIKKLKSEIAELKNNGALSFNKQTKLNQKQSKLEKLEEYVDSKPLNNADYFPYILGGITVLIVGVVIGLLVSKKSKKLNRR